MSNTSMLPSVQPLAQSQPLACRLRPKEHVGKRGAVSFMAGVELENLSNSNLEIEYEMAVLQYLNLIVHDALGNVVSDHHYGDHFSPFEHAKLLRLGPGEQFHANVHLFATVSRRPIDPGTYHVQAIYEYNGFRAVSEPVEVAVQ